jgi:hypothetical protein
MLAENFPHHTKSNTRPNIGKLREGAFRRDAKSGTIGRRKRTAKTADQLFGVEITRCCHVRPLRETVALQGPCGS